MESEDRIKGVDYHTPLAPAVHDLTRDGRLSIYGESVLKLSKVSDTLPLFLLYPYICSVSFTVHYT
jgi:hypothetical protein